MAEILKSGVKFLKTGSERLAEQPNFKLVGREDFLAKLSTILLKKRANSVLVFGPGGVGVSALILGMQASKDEPGTSFNVISKRFMWLDTDGLFQSGNTEEVSGYFNKIIHTLNRTPNSILVIEDTRNFVDACNRTGCMHFINALCLAVKTHKTQIILEARDVDVDFLNGIHSDIKDQFSTLAVEEPTGDTLLKIVTDLAKGLSEHHHIKVSEDAIKTAIKVTTENRTKDQNLSRAQPERTMTLIDVALSAYTLRAHAAPAEGDNKDEWEKRQKTLRGLYDRLRAAEIELVNAEYDLANTDNNDPSKKEPDLDSVTANIANGGYKTAKQTQAEETVNLNQQVVEEIKNQIDTILKSENSKLELTKRHIEEQYSAMTGIPVSILRADERIVMRDLDITTKKVIFGQDAQVDHLSDIVRVATYGRRRADEPGAALCCGPSGVGKSEYWKQLARILGRPLFTFDMSEYSEKNAAAKLIGAVPGYELAGIGGQLTNAILEFPYGIFLFDEIEKAHDNLFNIFLQVLSDGRLTDNAGRKCSFRRALLGFTSNIGQPRFLDFSLTPAQQREAATEDLKGKFRSEFLNRFGGRENIIWFDSLKEESLTKIVDREFVGINDAYADKGIITTISEADVKAFVHDRYDPVNGARGLPGVINKTVDSIIIKAQLDNPSIKGTLDVVYNENTKQLATSMEDGVKV